MEKQLQNSLSNYMLDKYHKALARFERGLQSKRILYVLLCWYFPLSVYAGSGISEGYAILNVASICPSVGGTVSGAATVCSGSNSNTLTLSGHTGSIIKWQSSTNGGSSWSDIANTSTSQSYTNLAQTTRYRAVVQSGTCAAVNSSEAAITVNARPTTAVLAGTAAICPGTSTPLTVTVTGGTSPYSVFYSGGTVGTYTSGSNISVSPSSTTNYTLTSVTDANGCVAKTASGTATVTLKTTAMSSGYWDDPNIWSCGSKPNMQTSAELIAGMQVTLNNAAVCNSVSLGSNAQIELGNFNLTVGGNIVGGSSASHIVTNGTGSLIMPTPAGVTTVFPVGVSSSSYDPVSLTPTNGTTFSVNVSPTFSNPVADPNKVAPREWNITPTAGTPDATVLNLTYSGCYQANVSGQILGHFNGSKWEELLVPASTPAQCNLASGSSVGGIVSIFSPFGIGLQGGFVAVLAAEMKSVKASSKGTLNVVEWVTLTEQTVKEFVLERSTNGQSNWVVIGKQVANNKPSSYSLTDKNPLNVSYYRIVTVDLDGKIATSKVVSVATQKQSMLKAYPSVSSGVLTLEGVENGIFHIYNLLGQEVITGRTAQQINVSALSQGTYILRVGTEQVTFFKQK